MSYVVKNRFMKIIVLKSHATFSRMQNNLFRALNKMSMSIIVHTEMRRTTGPHALLSLITCQ